MTPSLTSTDITGREFTLSSAGYDPQEVRGFLRRLAREVRRLEGEIEGQQARIRVLEDQARAHKEEAFNTISKRFAAAMRAADEAADRMRADAQEEARKIISSAKDEAAAIISAARREVERLRDEAREADRAPGPASATAPSKGSVEIELDAVQRQLGSVASMFREIDIAQAPAGDGEATATGGDDLAEAATEGRGGAPAT